MGWVFFKNYNADWFYEDGNADFWNSLVCHFWSTKGKEETIIPYFFYFSKDSQSFHK